MLAKLRQNHQGVEKTKRFTRGIMFWPGMSAQIAETVGRKEPMQCYDIPTQLWQKVGTDLFEFDTS